ncbi:hypothetical protein ADH66_01070 [Acutalibacter muris]|uniref:Uncharacterized protein n=1 Tax=Acutalibacter muris TaxID=1796620 RepID=A0ABN4ZZ68_9FIRM|nr:hypothetical protein A4V00_19595 [Hungateiclostridiaceae bacterium KB18]ASB39371.1 hypothetical protein ADH66_01070 [Acutalibacter muris]
MSRHRQQEQRPADAVQVYPILDVLLFFDVGDVRDFLFQDCFEKRRDIFGLAHDLPEDEVVGQIDVFYTYAHGNHLLSANIIPESVAKSNSFVLPIVALHCRRIFLFQRRLHQPGQEIHLFDPMEFEIFFHALIGFFGHLNCHRCPC